MRIRKEVQEGGGLAGLSGSGQHDHWPRLRGALQTGFNIARNPHMQNIRYNRIFCTNRKFACCLRERTQE